MPPKGGWKPALNVSTVLASIGLLLAEPNPEDGLVTDIVRCCMGVCCTLCCRQRLQSPSRPSLSPTVCSSWLIVQLPSHPDRSAARPAATLLQTAEFKHQRQVFDSKARQWTQRHAMPSNGGVEAAAAGWEAAAAGGCDDSAEVGGGAEGGCCHSCPVGDCSLASVL